MANRIINRLDIIGCPEASRRMLQKFQTEQESRAFILETAGSDGPAYGFDPTIKFGEECDLIDAEAGGAVSDITVFFDTKWSPAYHWVVALAREFPELSIFYSYGGLCGEQDGDVRFHDGEIEIEEHGCQIFRLKDWLARRLKELESVRDLALLEATRSEATIQPPDRKSVDVLEFPRSKSEAKAPDAVSIQSLDHDRRSYDRSDPRQERADDIRRWDATTKNLTRYRCGNAGEMTEWLNSYCPDALTMRDDPLGDRDDDWLYVALYYRDAAIFEDRWRAEVSVLS